MNLTLPQLESLEERRAIKVRHARFNAALVTSVVANVNRSAESEPLSPFDFLPGYERSAEEVEAEKTRKSIKHAIVVAMTQMGSMTQAQADAERVNMIARMRANNVEDPEGIFSEAFPDWGEA